MCGKIDCYITAFAQLKTDNDEDRWPAATTHRAPHKPILLLSVLDLVAQGKVTKEFIEVNQELEETFSSYWQKVIPDISGSLAEPFCLMEKEPFWTLVQKPGVKVVDGEVEFTLERLKELYFGARIDKELFQLLLMEPLRRRLREVLVQTYFIPEVQSMLFQESSVRSGLN